MGGGPPCALAGKLGNTKIIAASMIKITLIFHKFFIIETPVEIQTLKVFAPNRKLDLPRLFTETTFLVAKKTFRVSTREINYTVPR